MAIEDISSALLRTTGYAKKKGKAAGIFSVCSSHPTVLETSLQIASRRKWPLLIESTCNQVNQDGGYTSQTPAQFAAFVGTLAEKNGFPTDRLILGGDHLGPYPWRNMRPEIAMEKGCELVRACVQAGYAKIHLDASMPCGGEADGSPLDPALVAERSAILCRAGETAYQLAPAGQPAPLYVIGSEVPPPGGAFGAEAGPRVTHPEDAYQTIQLTRKAFLEQHLDEAWQRVIAVVVQPGVEFGDQVVYPYEQAQASELSLLIERFDNFVFEAHSTDYQSARSLRQLVQDHFAILKVGPALTFAYREAVFALALIEQELLGGRAGVEISRLPETLEQVMLANPGYWLSFYQGDPAAIQLALLYSYSDRCRYYWPHPEVQAALKRLFDNLSAVQIPPTMVSQYLPRQYRRLRDGKLGDDPGEWVRDRIADVLRDYGKACGW